MGEQPLVWAASERFHVDPGAPLPLALGAVSCLWRREADDALAEAERPTRGLVFSKNFSAIGTVVRAGLAATTLPESMVGEGLRMYCCADQTACESRIQATLEKAA